MSYATLEDLKAEVGIDDADTVDDDTLTANLAAASAAVDTWCDRTFTVATEAATARRFTALTGSRVLVDDIGDAAGLVVEVRSDATWTPVAVELFPFDRPSSLLPATTVLADSSAGARFPLGEGAIRVTARWGWPAVPEQVKRATILTAARLWKRKDAPLGIAGSADLGTMRLVPYLDPDAQVLLNAFRSLRGQAL